MRKSALIAVLAVLAAGTASAAAPPDAGVADKAAPPSGAPQREQEYLALIEKARKQYAAAKSVDARKNARVGLQIAAHEFMGLSHDARNWIGTFKSSQKTAEGDRSIELEIAPGVTIATWNSRYFDNQYDTLIKPYSPLAPVLNGLTIGQPVTFSATLIGAIISTDYDMIQRHRVIAKITQLAPIK